MSTNSLVTVSVSPLTREKVLGILSKDNFLPQDTPQTDYNDPVVEFLTNTCPLLP